MTAIALFSVAGLPRCLMHVILVFTPTSRKCYYFTPFVQMGKQTQLDGSSVAMALTRDRKGFELKPSGPDNLL
jgi:hypothetical protein